MMSLTSCCFTYITMKTGLLICAEHWIVEPAAPAAWCVGATALLGTAAITLLCLAVLGELGIASCLGDPDLRGVRSAPHTLLLPRQHVPADA